MDEENEPPNVAKAEEVDEKEEKRDPLRAFVTTPRPAAHVKVASSTPVVLGEIVMREESDTDEEEDEPTTATPLMAREENEGLKVDLASSDLAEAANAKPIDLNDLTRTLQWQYTAQPASNTASEGSFRTALVEVDDEQEPVLVCASNRVNALMNAGIQVREQSESPIHSKHRSTSSRFIEAQLSPSKSEMSDGGAQNTSRRPIHPSHKTPPWITMLICLLIITANVMTCVGFNRASDALGSSSFAVSESFNSTAQFLSDANTTVVAVANKIDSTISIIEFSLDCIDLSVESMTGAVKNQALSFTATRASLDLAYLKLDNQVNAMITDKSGGLQTVLASASRVLGDRLVHLFRSFFISRDNSASRRLGTVSSVAKSVDLGRVQDLLNLCDSVRDQIKTVRDIVQGVKEANATAAVESKDGGGKVFSFLQTLGSKAASGYQYVIAIADQTQRQIGPLVGASARRTLLAKLGMVLEPQLQAMVPPLAWAQVQPALETLDIAALEAGLVDPAGFVAGLLSAGGPAGKRLVTAQLREVIEPLLPTLSPPLTWAEAGPMLESFDVSRLQSGLGNANPQQFLEELAAEWASKVANMSSKAETEGRDLTESTGAASLPTTSTSTSNTSVVYNSSLIASAERQCEGEGVALSAACGVMVMTDSFSARQFTDFIRGQLKGLASVSSFLRPLASQCGSLSATFEDFRDVTKETGKLIKYIVTLLGVGVSVLGPILALSILIYAWRIENADLDPDGDGELEWIEIIEADAQDVCYAILYFLGWIFVILSFYLTIVIAALAGVLVSLVVMCKQDKISDTKVCDAMNENLFNGVVAFAVGSILNALLSVHLLAALQAAYSKYETDQSTPTWHKIKKTAAAAVKVPGICCQCCRSKLPKNRAIKKLKPQLLGRLEQQWSVTQQWPSVVDGWSEVRVILRREKLADLRRAVDDPSTCDLLAEKVVLQLKQPKDMAQQKQTRLSQIEAHLTHLPHFKMPQLPFLKDRMVHKRRADNNEYHV